MKKTNPAKPTDAAPAESGFPYSLELVATIAAHFATAQGDAFDVAVQHAIELIDATLQTIEGRSIVLRYRQEQARSWAATPSQLTFEKGAKLITGQPNALSATKAFGEYIRMNFQLGMLNFPHEFQPKDIPTLRPLSRRKQQEAKKRLIAYQSDGFRQDELVSIKSQYDRQAALMRSHTSSQSGKKGGRPKGSKDTQKRQRKKTSQKP